MPSRFEPLSPSKHHEQMLPARAVLEQSAGTPLDSGVAKQMGSAFGHSFTDVRVHTGPRAARAAAAVGAEAFTVGHDIAFRAGRYAPHSSRGIRLLAHELTHVVQQCGHVQAPHAHLPESHPADAGEREAEAVADAVTAGSPIGAISSSPPRLQRACGHQALGTPKPDCPVSDVGVVGWQFRFKMNCNELLPGEEEKFGRLTSGNTLHIHGFASQEGPTSFNWELSCHRANRIAELATALRPDCHIDSIVKHGPSPVEAPGAPTDLNQSSFWRMAIVREAPPRPEPKADLQPLTVVVIGSPSPDQRYQLQFATAAECLGKDMNTIWIVEKTGYEIYGISLDYFTTFGPPGGLIWLTPGRSLTDILNKFPDGSIGRLVVYSHGVPGQVTLRYGWGSLSPDYGLSIPDVARLSSAKFAKDAEIEFNSCNTGSETDEGANLAQEFAEQTGQPVRAWTGRTSYSGINKGTCSVGPSRVTGAREFFTEQVWSRWAKGRDPHLRTFTPKRPRE